MAEWMDQFPEFEREAAKARRKHKKLEDGGGIMLRGTIIPVDYIGAYVVHLPKVVAHPVEDRYLSIAEGKAIMGLPLDMEVLDVEKNYNHICQNVPFATARDMAVEVKAVGAVIDEPVIVVAATSVGATCTLPPNNSFDCTPCCV